MSNKSLTVGLIAIAIIAVAGWFFPLVQQSFGSAGTRFQNGISVGTNTAPTARGLKVGDNGSEFTELKATTCNLIGTDGSQTASTTSAYSCAVTGVASGDVVMAILSSSTPAFPQTGVNPGWMIIGAKASTTAGFVEVLLTNFTGAAAIPSVTSVGSSTNVWYADI